MNSLLSQHIANLKSALLSLPATGERGFEGLIGAALHEISGVPFRLAGSGLQFGVDGKPTFEGDSICFEGKRYEDPVPRPEVLSKIAELSIKDSSVDIWVLGATSQVRSQLVDDALELGNKNGIFVLILDWSETELAPFAVALAMGGKRVQEFLKSTISSDKTLRRALKALEAIRSSQDFAPLSDRIRTQCSEPAVGWILAQKANSDWVNEAFSSRKLAKLRFGQPLSPSDTTAIARQRKTLTDKLYPYLTAAPDETVVCVLGDEGNGKSWIVAQSWLTLAHKPMIIFMNPDDFAEMARRNDIIDLLISKLIEQTGDRDTAIIRERWRRRLQQWRRNTAIDNPRLIVVIDGINQRPNADWARIIESVNNALNQYGGRLIVTARIIYFLDHIKRRLSTQFTEIHVPEWSEYERDEILAEHGIKASLLHPSVARSLRNPRLLGIALELLDKADILNFEELNVTRLLFEYMRISERDAPVPQPMHEFVQKLREQAREIISRIKSNQQDDINVFKKDIGAVADGRFYKQVDGDPAHYSLNNDGLILALGFAIIDRLHIARRSMRSLDAELEAVLEPIVALDSTANVVLAALTLITVDEHYKTDIASALIKGFATLQNPDQTQFPIFIGLAKKRPHGFMDAAQVLSLAGGDQPNFDWIQGALRVASKNSSSWLEMVKIVNSWLSFYSLSPERNCILHLSRDPQEKVEEEREKNKKKIKEKLKALSAEEQAILVKMQEEDGDLSSLSRLTFLLLAGKSLAPFAKSFLNWSFSNALNSDYTAPDEDFMHLVRLNRVDWPQTRTTLLQLSSPLRNVGVSRIGKWALINILRATGSSEDGKELLSLVKDLNKDMPHSKNWRLVEEYCATDPCDPTSKQPKNIMRTAEQYAAFDVSKLRQSWGQTTEDFFFDKALPGIARFKPDIAIAKYKELIADVLIRSGALLERGLSDLRKHSSLITDEEARKLIKILDEPKNGSLGALSGLSKEKAWIISQYIMLLAFPFLNAKEQTEVLLSNESDKGVFVDLLNMLKPLSEKNFENLIEIACRQNNERMQYILLMFAKYTSTQLSTDTITHIAALFQSQSEHVRIEALAVISQSDDKKLLDLVSKSGWKASETRKEYDKEAWYGSIALLKAASKGLLPHNEVLDRISEHLYGRAATLLDIDAVREIARRIDASINQVIDLESDLVAPDVEIKIHPSNPYEHCMSSLSVRSSNVEDRKEVLDRISESEEAFEQQQRRNYNSHLEFKTNLTKAKAHIILDHLEPKEFASVVGSIEGISDRWHGLFMRIAETKLPAIHNLVLLLAYSLGSKAPDKAEELFLRVKNIRFTYKGTNVPLDAKATWAGVRSPILDKLRFARLDLVGADHDLSLEVLAALIEGQKELLTEYIEVKLHKEEPSEVARGIMVAGFSDQSEFNDEIINRFEGNAGLIGAAQRAAKYTYERNIWARHWFEKMCMTHENSSFWCYSVLFLKIVDGRFLVWHSKFQKKGRPIQLFGSALDDRLKNRFEKWENHRNKKLFGLDAPAPIFLQGTDGNN
jgi:hypothetical protein